MCVCVFVCLCVCRNWVALRTYIQYSCYRLRVGGPSTRLHSGMRSAFEYTICMHNIFIYFISLLYMDYFVLKYFENSVYNSLTIYWYNFFFFFNFFTFCIVANWFCRYTLYPLRPNLSVFAILHNCQMVFEKRVKRNEKTTNCTRNNISLQKGKQWVVLHTYQFSVCRTISSVFCFCFFPNVSFGLSYICFRFVYYFYLIFFSFLRGFGISFVYSSDI